MDLITLVVIIIEIGLDSYRKSRCHPRIKNSKNFDFEDDKNLIVILAISKIK